MKSWKNAVVLPTVSLESAISRIDGSGLQLAIALDDNGRLAGTLSDGDVRRAILRGVSLSTPISEVMNRDPLVAHASTPPADLLVLMRRKVLHHIPLVNDARQVVELATLDELVGLGDRPNRVVLMAGGLGTRLRPLTDNCPKPMLPINGKPILERIIESFAEQGFRHFFLSVNYLAEQIQSYFGDGSSHGVEIQYLQEGRRLGTAGALSLLPDLPDEPLIVMNADLLTRVRFDQMIKFHDDHFAAATMAVREYDFQVPYGVVNLDGATIKSIDEKPVQRFFVNAGIYTLSPESLEHIPGDAFFDMPALFDKLLSAGKTTTAYPLREYWMDIGHIDEFERAQREWFVGGEQ